MQPPTKKPALADDTGTPTPSTPPKSAMFSLPEGKRKSIMRDLGIHAASDPGEVVDNPPGRPENLLELQVEKPQTIESTKDTRMVISFIKVENFKSFRGVHEIGPLHKNMNVIAGANGSGKSNVIEAVLFCFGAQEGSARCKNLVESIHKTDGCEREERCAVEVTFHRIKDEDHHKFTCYSDTKFTIARQIQKSTGRSTYYFDGEVKTLDHNKEFLKRIGIDMTFNRNAILQGNIQEICMMSEGQLLKFVENYAETHRFIEPIEKLEKKVAELNVQFSNEKCQYNAIKRHIPAYHDLAMKNVKFINTHNELNLSQAKFYKYQILDLEPKLLAARTTYQDKEKDAVEKKNLLEKKKQDSTDAVKKADQLWTAYRNAEKHYSEVKRRCDQWLEMDREMKNELKEDKGNMDRIGEDISKIKDSMQRMNSEETALESSIATDTLHLQNFSLKINSLEESATQNFMDYEAEVSNDKQLLDAVTRELGGMKEKQAEVEKEFREIEDKCQRMIVWDVEKERKNLDKAKKELEKMVEKHEKLERDLTTKLNEKAQIERTASPSKLNEYENQLLCQNQRLTHITRDLNIYKSSASNSGIASYRSEEARLFITQHRSNVDGVVGCLGDLVTTSKQYNKAISTMLGKKLDIVLCDTVENGAAAILYLRRNKLKQLTFIAKEQARNWSEQGINADRRLFPKPLLFDQIDFPGDADLRDLLRKVLFSFLGNTLIVKDRAEYSSMSINTQKQFNVVTENGEYIQSNGNITGGGASFNRIRLKTGLSDSEKRKSIEKLESEQKEAKDKIEMLQSQCGNQKNELAILQILEQDIGRLRQEISENSPELKQQEVAIKDRMISTTAAMTQSEYDHEQNLKWMKFQELQKENELVEEKEKERNILEQRINAVYKEKVKKPRLELKKLKEQSQSLAQQIENSRAKLGSHPKRLQKLEGMLQEKEKSRKEAVEKYNSAKAKDNEQCKKMAEDLNKEAGEKKTAYQNALKDHRTAIGHQLQTSRELDEAELCSTESDELFKEARQQYISIGDELEGHRQEFESCRRNLLDVKSWDPQLQLELDQGSIVLPDDVIEGLDQKFLEQFEEIDVAGNLNEEDHSRKNLEAKLKNLQNSVDKEGIRKYTMAINALNDVFFSKEKTAKILRQHRLKLNEFKRARHQEFTEVLQTLSDNVSRLYRLLIPGGNAMLKMVTDSLTDGVQYRIRPSGKTWSDLQERSGGEKSLASLVLVLALLEFRSTPIFLMDEVDAALDFRIVKRIAQFLKVAKDSLNAQFLVVSHREEMIKEADRLVGIYARGRITEGTIIVAPEMIGDLVRNLARAFAECDLSDRNINRLGQDEEDDEEDQEEL